MAYNDKVKLLIGYIKATSMRTKATVVSGRVMVVAYNDKVKLLIGYIKATKSSC